MDLSDTRLIKQFQTRFLLPFYFRPNCIRQIVDSLQADSRLLKKGNQPLWETSKPHDLYIEEMLDPVVDLLFPLHETGVCPYLRLSDKAASQWFNHIRVKLGKVIDLEVRLVNPAGIELFLCDQGAGILSFTLSPAVDSLTWTKALLFNNKVSQMRHYAWAFFRRPHPEDNTDKWSKLTDEKKSRIPAPPEDSKPLIERLGKPGGVFSLSELATSLLQPMESHDFSLFQSQFSVYTVARFDHTVDLSSSGIQREMRPLLSSFVQIRKSGHAETDTASYEIENVILNRCHWSATGLLGTTHLVADQTDTQLSSMGENNSPHPFNQARVVRAIMKYYIPYLAAFFERLILLRFKNEVAKLAHMPHQESPEKMINLNHAFQKFTMRGYFTQASNREAVQRYFQICQKGMSISDALDQAKQSMTDLGGKADHQIQTREVKGLFAKIPDNLKNEMIFHYKIIDKIGRGGQGIVYKAEDTKLHRQVAIKFLSPELLRNQESKSRFFDEARAAALLDHINICTIFDIEEIPDQAIFIVMAYYEGKSIKDILKSGPLNPSEARDIAIQAAQGLEKAHTSRIIHRDIKPGNIMLTQDKIVKILDFGIAKQLDVTSLTSKEQILGTTWYLSPEQLNSEKLDFRTDIWSLGIVLYEILTNKPPFQGERAESIMYQILYEEPDPITSVRKDLEPGWNQILMRTLRKNASDRYQTMGEFISDLNSLDISD